MEINYLQDLCRQIRSSNNVEVIKIKLSEFLHYYQVLNFRFNTSSTLWRARKCEGENGYETIDQLLCPPINLALAGRLNEPGERILYTSINQFSALDEIGAKEGDHVQFVGFEIVPETGLTCGIIGEKMNVHRSGRAWMSDYLTDELNRILSEMEFSAGKSYVFSDAFLANILSDEKASESQYIHSRTLSRMIFTKQCNLDALIYPSVALGGSMNFAIKPHAIGKKIRIGATFVVKINKKFDYGLYDSDIVLRADGQWSDGRVKWLEKC